MNKNKKLLKYLGIIFLAVLITYKLPHHSYSIIQYIIRPIKFENSAVYLSGIIPLVLFFVGIRGLLNLERFAGKNKLVLFIAVTAIVIPAMRWTLDITRTNYHWLKGDGLKALDIVDTNVNLKSFNDELTINLKLEVIDYGRGRNEFKVRIYLPKPLSDYVGGDFYEFEDTYRTYGNRNTRIIEEQIVIELDDGHMRRNQDTSPWYWEDFKYELYNTEEVIQIIEHGL